MFGYGKVKLTIVNSKADERLLMRLQRRHIRKGKAFRTMLRYRRREQRREAREMAWLVRALAK